MKLEELSLKNLVTEEEIVEELLKNSKFLKKNSGKIFKRAKKYVKNIREHSDELNIEAFMKEYSLSSYEGIAILCLAEALLRVPDSRTADELIFDKLGKGNWKDHIDDDSSFLMNSSAFGLMLGEEILSLDKKDNPVTKAVGKLIKRIGEPVIRNAIKHAMRILGSKFVLGTKIDDALEKAQKYREKGYLFSFDMLGEGARNANQAEKFFSSYVNGAIAIGKNFDEQENLYARPNISVKLSALHPRYELKKKDRVLKELLPKLKDIIAQAKDSGLWVSIDAEESYRLELSLIIFEEMLKDPKLQGWEGLGFVVQAYNKRAKYVLEFLKSLSKKYKRKIPVRLVKGAYWDAEIKHAQVEGLTGFPVFTRKSHTDLSYLVCAKFMLDNLNNFYPQFATHNALTVASILETAPKNKGEYEFQRLFGMGDSFYDQLVSKMPCRIYAPVGSYEELLPYLIRRILENGANTSFVNLVVDRDEPIGEILTDPVEKILNKAYTSKLVALPKDIYGEARENSKGYDYGNILQVEEFKKSLKTDHAKNINPNSIIEGKDVEAGSKDIIKAIDVAQERFNTWKDEPIEKKVKCALRLANLIENNSAEIISILAYEAKKTVKDSIFEIREAVDFLRFYASEANKLLDPAREAQKGYTGELSKLTYRPKGVFACISPWNFPLSIFIGQISAALVTGNCVIAKPAEQTSKIAYYITKLAHQAGFPVRAFQLIIGKGSKVGKYITSSNHIAGVVFTGSTEVANLINKSLNERENTPIATFIAETGGQNCFIVDSSALLERACDDLIESAFGSAGQKCSAARVAYIQEDIYEELIELLSGAVSELKIAEASNYETDIAGVIDKGAKEELSKHIRTMKRKFKMIAKGVETKASTNHCLLPPHIFEIDNISALKKENFGPILHLIKFKRKDIDKVITDINSTGYGLTFGIHSRIYNFVEYVTSRINAGNIYINRTSTGAVVETHPFGGMGLSGTGPKAGGPNYLKRFLHEVTITDNTSAIGGNLELLT